MKLDSILEQSFNLLGFGKNAHESKLKEQDSNPHLKDLQIFKMSKVIEIKGYFKKEKPHNIGLNTLLKVSPDGLKIYKNCCS